VKTSLNFLSAVLAAAMLAGVAHANTGSVSQLSGTLSVRKADGSVRILSQKSEVNSGDTLNTERDTYAQIRFTDGGQITLKPGTSVKIEDFKFSEEKPQEDSFLFSLVKGGLRAVTGIVGKRSHDNFRMNTATATIGVRGTTFTVDDCLSRRDGDCGHVEPAVHVSVVDGEVVVKNDQGELACPAGTFCMIGRGQRPLFLSTDPGLQFTPPASFIRSVMAGSTVNSGKNLECQVKAR
jgi:hypothetical protein